MMKWLKVIGYGVLLWILMFGIVSITVAFGLYNFVWVQAILAVISGIIAFVLAGKLKPNKVEIALVFGVIWIIISVALDALVTMKFNPEIFLTWALWAGYILVLLAPILRVKKEV